MVERDLTSTGDQKGAPRFDPYVGADVLRKLAELASDGVAMRVMDPIEPSFVAAVGVLRDANAWLEQYRTPFESFGGDVLLAASVDPSLLVTADSFANTLSSIALELSAVAKLVELRDVWLSPPSARGSQS